MSHQTEYPSNLRHPRKTRHQSSPRLLKKTYVPQATNAELGHVAKGHRRHCCSGSESIALLAQQNSPKHGRRGSITPATEPGENMLVMFKPPPPTWPFALGVPREQTQGRTHQGDTEATGTNDSSRGANIAERFVASRGKDYQLIRMRDETSITCRAHDQLVRDRQGRVGRVVECYDCNGDRMMEVSTSCEWKVVNVHSSDCTSQNAQFQYFWNVYTNRAQLQAPASLTEIWTSTNSSDPADSPTEECWCRFRGLANEPQ